jgi:hypothetical protein|tara:strand:+ start:710 stop:1087 length:378 start_codon:yes stop_codon:yes gene_type:complete
MSDKESIYRLEDIKSPRSGSSGKMSDAYKMIEGKAEIVGNRPIIGTQLMVGESFNTIYWWKCSPIQEILIEEDNYVKFRTTTSIYEWWCYSKEEFYKQMEKDASNPKTQEYYKGLDEIDLNILEE